MSDELDKADFIRDPYTLIVSSPGLGRALTKDRHLSQSIGEDVEIHLYKPHPETGEKDLRGELVEFDAGQIVILADPPVPGKGKGKGKGKKKSQASMAEVSMAEADQESADAAQPQDTPQASGQGQDGPAVQADGRIRMALDRKTIASVKLAFDF